MSLKLCWDVRKHSIFHFSFMYLQHISNKTFLSVPSIFVKIFGPSLSLSLFSDKKRLVRKCHANSKDTKNEYEVWISLKSQLCWKRNEVMELDEGLNK